MQSFNAKNNLVKARWSDENRHVTLVVERAVLATRALRAHVRCWCQINKCIDKLAQSAHFSGDRVRPALSIKKIYENR